MKLYRAEEGEQGAGASHRRHGMGGGYPEGGITNAVCNTPPIVPRRLPRGRDSYIIILIIINNNLINND